MAGISLTWDQVSAWRLARHGLAPRLGRDGTVEAARRTGGLQAQVLSAAELALATRVEGMGSADVQAALWQQRTLVHTWAMRATLHLLDARDLPLYVAARRASETRNWLASLSEYGVTQDQYAAYLAAGPEILGDEPMTRAAFAQAVAERTGVPELGRAVGTQGWSSSVKPLAWRGHLILGPAAGRSATYVNPRRWLQAWPEIDPQAALQEVARRYLSVYGPATPGLFARWWELRVTEARVLFRTLAEELVPVKVEGWQGMALARTVQAMREAPPPDAVRLLPLFDAYTVGIGRGADIAPLLAPQHHARVYRQAGWISAVLLVDGRVAGVWDSKRRGAETLLTVRPFDALHGHVQAGIAAEAERLAAYWGMPVTVAYAHA